MMLACVILGDAPERLRERLYDTLDSVHVDYANQSAEFDGDVSSFDGVERHIDPLVSLNEKTIDTNKRSSVIKKVGFSILLCTAFVALCVYFFNRYSTLSTVEHYMQQTPGLAMTDAYWDLSLIHI